MMTLPGAARCTSPICHCALCRGVSEDMPFSYFSDYPKLLQLKLAIKWHGHLILVTVCRGREPPLSFISTAHNSVIWTSAGRRHFYYFRYIYIYVSPLPCCKYKRTSEPGCAADWRPIWFEETFGSIFEIKLLWKNLLCFVSGIRVILEMLLNIFKTHWQNVSNVEGAKKIK